MNSYIARSIVGTDVYRSIQALNRDFNIPPEKMGELEATGFTVVDGPDGITDLKEDEINTVVTRTFVDDALLQRMTQFGGGFVKLLAELYRKADAENRHLIRCAFEHYFLKYGPDSAFVESDNTKEESNADRN